MPTKTLSFSPLFEFKFFLLLLFFSLFCGPSSLSLFELLLPSNPRKKKKKFYPLPPALSSYPRKSDRLPKFPFDLFRAERVEQNLYREIHRYPTGLTRGKRLKDAGGRMRADGGKGKRKRLEKFEKTSSPFVFLSFGRRLVLKRWSQKFSFEFFNFCGSQLLLEIQNTHALQKKAQKRGERERRRRSSHYPPPPLLRARVPFFFFFFFSISSVLLPVFACAGESFGKRKQRGGVEREAASVRFSARIFLLYSLSLSCFVPLSLSRSLSLSPCFRSAASCSRLVQQNNSYLPLLIK